VDPATHAKLEAAARALREARPRDAIATLLDVAEEAASTRDAQTELYARTLLGPAAVAIGDFDQAQAHGERALELARGLGDDDTVAQAHRFLREISPDAAFFGGQDGERDEETAGDVIDQAFDTAARALTRGDGVAAANVLAPILEEATQFGDLAVEASARGMMAQAMMMVGHLDEARAQAQRARDIALFTGDDGARQHFDELIGQLGSPDEAAQAMAAARVASRARATLGVAGQALEGGDADGALQVLWPVLAEATASGALGAEASLRGLIAQALLAQGRKTEAIEQANRAAQLADDLGDRDAGSNFRQIAELALGFLPPAGEA